MADLRSELNVGEQGVFDETDYNEEEDEDFDPSKERLQQSDDDEYDDNTTILDNSRQKSRVDYSRIESDTGGLVKTRRARFLQEELDRKRKYEDMERTTVSESIKDVWEELKDISNKRLKARGSSGSILNTQLSSGSGALKPSMEEETITIKRDYVFAGEKIHEEKLVPASSAEAQEYLNSMKFQQKAQVKPLQEKDSKTMPITKENMSFPKKGTKLFVSDLQLKNLRRPLKRPPILEQIISGSLKPKLTTLEKSSLDWATYVDKEGINDELTLHNKDGYLAKQDFLDRVEHRKDSQYKELRQKQLSMQAQQNQ